MSAREQEHPYVADLFPPNLDWWITFFSSFELYQVSSMVIVLTMPSFNGFGPMMTLASFWFMEILSFFEPWIFLEDFFELRLSFPSHWMIGGELLFRSVKSEVLTSFARMYRSARWRASTKVLNYQELTMVERGVVLQSELQMRSPKFVAHTCSWDCSLESHYENLQQLFFSSAYFSRVVQWCHRVSAVSIVLHVPLTKLEYVKVC